MRCLARAHAPNCVSLRYENLGDPDTYQKLSRFLDTSSFDYQSQIGRVKDASNKTDPTAVLIRQRMDFLVPSPRLIQELVQAWENVAEEELTGPCLFRSATAPGALQQVGRFTSL